MPPRVLVMTYWFPPSGGGGVQRIAKFVRYLPENGWMPAVVAAEPVEGRETDQTLADEIRGTTVVRTPARHLPTTISGWTRKLRPSRGRAARSATATAPSGGDGVAARPAASGSSRLVQWIGLPDEVFLWIRPAVRAAVKQARIDNVSAVLATGPPFSVLVAGERVARRLGVPFVADMRDAWRDNPLAPWPTGLHKRSALRTEHRVLSSAAAVVVASENIAEEAREMGGEDVRVLLNGFDPADLPERRAASEPAPGSTLRIAFMGKFYGATDPSSFLAGFSLALARGADIRLDIAGTCSASVREQVTGRGLVGRVTLHGYLPHRQALELVADADVGLIVVAPLPGSKAILTGKLFEYLGLGVSVLVCGPSDGAAAELVSSLGAGYVVAPDDPQAVAELIVQLVADKRDGRLRRASASDVAQFDRRLQTRALGELLREVTAT